MGATGLLELPDSFVEPGWRRIDRYQIVVMQIDTQAPTSGSIFKASTGSSGGRTTSPKGSRPRLPTVQRPKENLSWGLGDRHRTVGARYLRLTSATVARVCLGLYAKCVHHVSRRGKKVLHAVEHIRNWRIAYVAIKASMPQLAAGLRIVSHEISARCPGE